MLLVGHAASAWVERWTCCNVVWDSLHLSELVTAAHSTLSHFSIDIKVNRYRNTDARIVTELREQDCCISTLCWSFGLCLLPWGEPLHFSVLCELVVMKKLLNKLIKTSTTDVTCGYRWLNVLMINLRLIAFCLSQASIDNLFQTT